MRTWAALSAVLAAAGLQAQGALESAKKDIVLPSTTAPSSPGVGVIQLVQLIVAMAAVLFLLKWLLPKMLAKFSKKLNPTLSGSIKIEESASFAGGMLYVVSARNKQLLLCAGQQGVSCLADLTEPANAIQDPPAFFEVLDEAKAKPAPQLFKAAVHAVDTNDSEPKFEPADVKAALERLERLAG